MHLKQQSQLKVVVYAALVIIFSVGVIGPVFSRTPYATTAKSDPVIQPKLNQLVQGRPAGATEKVWILFRDKGIRSEAGYHAALRRAEERFAVHALARRAKVRSQSPLVDFRDLPVHEPYIRQIRQMDGVHRLTPES